MTKATPVPHSPRPTEPAGAPPAEHELFPSALAADEEDDSSARASDNGGGTSGNHGNGTAG
jgi:hypothetical protein